MDKLTSQWNALLQIPGTVINYWPGWFTFAVSDYAANMLIAAIPQVQGTGGTLVNAMIHGARQTVDFAAWDAIKMAGPVHM